MGWGLFSLGRGNRSGGRGLREEPEGPPPNPPRLSILCDEAPTHHAHHSLAFPYNPTSRSTAHHHIITPCPQRCPPPLHEPFAPLPRCLVQPLALWNSPLGQWSRPLSGGGWGGGLPPFGCLPQPGRPLKSWPQVSLAKPNTIGDWVVWFSQNGAQSRLNLHHPHPHALGCTPNLLPRPPSIRRVAAAVFEERGGRPRGRPPVFRCFFPPSIWDDSIC